jgi:16S rRNA (cytosine967-C5)-methyltransferase
VTPGARIRAAAELLDRLEQPPDETKHTEPPPADAVLNAWFRANRYIGAKDRRAIGDAVFQTLRQRGYIDWWLRQHAGLPIENRFRAMWTFAVHHGMSAGEIIAACDGSHHALPPLDADTRRRLELLDNPPADAPETLPDQASFPAWLLPEIERQFGAGAWAEMIALTQPAPTHLRVNTLKTAPAEAAAALTEAGVPVAPTRWAPAGLVLERRANLPGLKVYREGWIEVQDESSQLAALLVGAAPGMRVLDLCAGAGGKTLAMAATMRNRGRIVAGDVADRRLARMVPRLARAGVDIVEPVRFDMRGRVHAGLGQFDRVLVDAPCSSSGTWRRRPDTKWTLTPVWLHDRAAGQAILVEGGAERVARGGRLVFCTCSILPQEGRDVVDRFIRRAEGSFRVVPAGEVWREALGTDPPFEDPYMLLTPHRHGTDGFFAAVLERVA